MKKFYTIVSVLFLLLGIVHSVCTPFFYNSLSIVAMWFIGTGLSLIFLGFMNLSAIKANNKTVYSFSIICNIISLVFCSLLAVLLKEPQAFLSVILIISMTSCSILYRKKI